MSKVILYFGSFNPPHKGHMAIAEYVIGQCFADELWFVVSPHNPLKQASELASQQDRFNMVQLAVEGSMLRRRMKVCDVEFSMPQPSYTIDTIKLLQDQFPENTFAMLIGEDNMRDFHLWRDYETLLSIVEIYVYPRNGVINEAKYKEMHILNNAPRFDVSSTQIRELLKDGSGADKYLNNKVRKYILDKKIW